MRIITTPAEMQEWSRLERTADRTIGFVPTMGALHDGHVSLVCESTKDNDSTVLSVFVNPMQFNVRSDYAAYPRTTDDDIRIARDNGVDAVYMPTVETMYPEGASCVVEPGTAAAGMEGAHRPGHFRGVTTVVAKLFNAVIPDVAYFGTKDYQQLAVIRQMVRDLDFPLRIVGVETVREPDGLAMSSRNVRLGGTDRSTAPVIHRALSSALREHLRGMTDAAVLAASVSAATDSAPGMTTEYVSVVDPVTLSPVNETRDGAVICVAVWLGGVRLIDNVVLPRV